MAAIATLSLAHVDQKVLKHWAPNEAIFARKTARGGMRRYREQLSFTRIHVRRERHERVTQLLDRFLVSRPNRIYAKAKCNDENSRSNHVSKVGKG
jgi:hypothetical protein